MPENSSKPSSVEITALLIGADFLTIAHQLRRLLEESPQDFVQVAKLLQMSQRKAYYLASIDARFNDLNVDFGRLAAIGWTKLASISPYVNATNCEQLLALAEHHTVHDLTKLMNNEPVYSKTHAVVLHFSPAQYRVFRKVVLAHGGIKSGKGLFNKEEALT